MQSDLISTSVVLLLLVGVASAIVMPDYLTICSRNDPDLSECVKNSVHNLRPYLRDGIKELNVPAMDPLYIGDLNILEGGSTGINVRARKLNVFGAANFEIKKIRLSIPNRRFDFELNLPRLQGEGFYDINGNILALPIKGSGPFVGNFTNFYAYVKITYDVKEVNSIEYIQIKDFSVKVRTGKGRIRLDNLFGGDKVLGDVINDTINQNFEVFTNEVIGPIGDALEKKFRVIAVKILENFTYNELFPV